MAHHELNTSSNYKKVDSNSVANGTKYNTNKDLMKMAMASPSSNVSSEQTGVINTDDIDDESDSEEIKQIQAAIQMQQQMWIQKQIQMQQMQKKQTEQLNILKQNEMYLQIIPKAPSEVQLGAQYTARMSWDENGVPGLLNINEKDEIEEYDEGVNNDE
eukprot:732176_1